MRIPFDSLTLSAVVAEWQIFARAKVQKIIAPNEATIVISVYAGRERHLLLNWSAEFARAHEVSFRPKSAEVLTEFCTALRRNLLGGRIEVIRQRGFDRILEVGISSTSGDFMLVAELMGKHSNVMLVDSAGRVVAAAKWIGRRHSRRPILPNQPYEPPPFEPKPSLLQATPGANLREFEGLSPFLLRLIEAGTPLESIQESVKSDSYQAVIVPGSGAYPVSVAPLGLPETRAESISLALESHFEPASEAAMVEREQRQLAIQLERIVDAKQVALSGLNQALEAAQNSRRIQETGELILAYQAQIETGQTELAVWDYQGEPIKIPLLPDLTPAENADRLFRKARNAKAHAEDVRAQAAVMEADIAELRRLLGDLAIATTLAETGAVRSKADRHKWLTRQTGPTAKEDRPFAGHSVREAQSPGGYRVLYGLNATSNDFLTTKVAKPNDWWLHVRGATSAHVVIQTHNQPLRVGPADIEFAAKIAVRNSVQKHASYVPVDYTLKKYVRKPRGSAPGFAAYSQEKTLHVDP